MEDGIDYVVRFDSGCFVFDVQNILSYRAVILLSLQKKMYYDIKQANKSNDIVSCKQSCNVCFFVQQVSWLGSNCYFCCCKNNYQFICIDRLPSPYNSMKIKTSSYIMQANIKIYNLHLTKMKVCGFTITFSHSEGYISDTSPKILPTMREIEHATLACKASAITTWLSAILTPYIMFK